MRSKRIVVLTAAALLVLSAAALPALAADTVTINEPEITFEDGDPTVSITKRDGVGALFVSTPEVADQVDVRVLENTDLLDLDAEIDLEETTTLGDLESLSYRALRDAGADPQIASINITTLPWTGTYVYEPVYDTSGNPVTGEWETWDAFSDTARWWNTGDRDTFLTWEDIIEGNEDAPVWRMVVSQGSNNPGLESYVDFVEVDGVTYDFAPADDDPEDKDMSKNDGWQDFDFRNQGQCIRFVNTGKGSP